MDLLLVVGLVAVMIFVVAMAFRRRSPFTRIVVQKQPPIDIGLRMAIDAKSPTIKNNWKNYPPIPQQPTPTPDVDDAFVRGMAVGLTLDLLEDDVRRASQQSTPDDNFQAGGGSFGGGGASGSWDDSSSKSDTSSNDSSSSYDSGSSSSSSDF